MVKVYLQSWVGIEIKSIYLIGFRWEYKNISFNNWVLEYNL
jgi:hypothetical protein